MIINLSIILIVQEKNKSKLSFLKEFLILFRNKKERNLMISAYFFRI